ncbi:hypothetical protein D9611_008163 [Ephemerocybe angulata]|uniref:Uncharacterized protein n=1 Tax=Ephemerocybe angulata TaxID=980116 RepID=A0A8H5BZT7_9AGAR|nr:hypothetical protein D9611_008163 [Tulosesus angulatus]
MESIWTAATMRAMLRILPEEYLAPIVRVPILFGYLFSSWRSFGTPGHSTTLPYGHKTGPNPWCSAWEIRPDMDNMPTTYLAGRVTLSNAQWKCASAEKASQQIVPF